MGWDCVRGASDIMEAHLKHNIWSLSAQISALMVRMMERFTRGPWSTQEPMASWFMDCDDLAHWSVRCLILVGWIDGWMDTSLFPLSHRSYPLTQTFPPRASHVGIHSPPKRPTDTQRQRLGLPSCISPHPQFMICESETISSQLEHKIS